jgi:hypothetical protein
VHLDLEVQQRVVQERLVHEQAVLEQAVHELVVHPVLLAFPNYAGIFPHLFSLWM